MFTSSWSPTNGATTVIEALIAMLKEPSAENPLEGEIGKQLSESKDAFADEAQKWTIKYASWFIKQSVDGGGVVESNNFFVVAPFFSSVCV